MKSEKIIKLLEIAGVPVDRWNEAINSIKLAHFRADGLTRKKLYTRLFKAGSIAKKLKWEHNRLIEVDTKLAQHDIAPMLNITCNGDKGPWVETPQGGRPVEAFWLDRDPSSAEYKFAVENCYWCPGEHPRSRKARKAWYRRNGGEYYAWAKGSYLNPEYPVSRWEGEKGDYKVSVVACDGVWIINYTKHLYKRLYLEGRIGFEVDNVMGGPLAPQLWYPIPGYELRAPVTWSILPRIAKKE